MTQKQLQEVNNQLFRFLEEKQEGLPVGFNKTRFMQNCMAVLQDTKDVATVEPVSVARTMLKGAFLGLDFFNKECYAIVQNKNNNGVWVKELTFRTDYKGEKKLAKKYSINPIKDIYAKLIRDGDLFEEAVLNGQQVVNFKPKMLNNSQIIGAFAIALFQDGSMMYEVMNVTEIENVKKAYAKTDKAGKFSKAWENSTGEMYKKTVYRRLCKHIELDFDSIEQQKIWNETSEMEFEPKQAQITQKAQSSLDLISEPKQIETEGYKNENN